jgi:hypothetical protein
MRPVTYLLVTASLVFAFIFLEYHYGIADRILEFRESNGSAVPPDSGWNFTSGDHDYQIVIDVSGRSRFLTVLHGPAAAKKSAKHSKKIAPNPPPAPPTPQPGTTKDDPQAPPQQASPPATTPQVPHQVGTKL